MGPGRDKAAVTALATLILSSAMLIGMVSSASAATVIGDWKLKGGLKNSARTALKLVRVGDVAFQSVDVKGRTRKALVFDEGEGLKLKSIPRKARGSYSVSLLFELDAVDGYRRIMSFGPNDRDEGLYVEDEVLDLYDEIESQAVASADSWLRVHVTRNGKSGRMNVFVDGVKKLTYLDSGNQYKLRKGLIVLFQDNLVGAGTDEHPSGTVAGITMWRGTKAP